MNELEKRIIDLEIKFTHQEEFIYELNQVVVKQQEAIEQLIAQVKSLTEIQVKSEVGPTRSLKDDIPPHY